jgi:hypothetical protein
MHIFRMTHKHTRQQFRVLTVCHEGDNQETDIANAYVLDKLNILLLCCSSRYPLVTLWSGGWMGWWSWQQLSEDACIIRPGASLSYE